MVGVCERSPVNGLKLMFEKKWLQQKQNYENRLCERASCPLLKAAPIIRFASFPPYLPALPCCSLATQRIERSEKVSLSIITVLRLAFFELIDIHRRVLDAHLDARRHSIAWQLVDIFSRLKGKTSAEERRVEGERLGRMKPDRLGNDTFSLLMAFESRRLDGAHSNDGEKKKCESSESH